MRAKGLGQIVKKLNTGTLKQKTEPRSSGDQRESFKKTDHLLVEKAMHVPQSESQDNEQESSNSFTKLQVEQFYHQGHVKMVPLEEHEVHHLKTKDLIDFAQIVPIEMLKPKVQLEYRDTTKKDHKWKSGAIYSFSKFFSCIRKKMTPAFFEAKSKETKIKFDEFCNKVIKLFDDFFPLPLKYKIFLTELVKILHEEDLLDGDLLNKCIFLEDILLESHLNDSSDQLDVFFTSLESSYGSFKRSMACEESVSVEYGAFQDRCRELIKNLNEEIKEESSNEIESKIKKFAEDMLFGRPDSKKDSFFRTMLSDPMLGDRLSIDQIRALWVDTRDAILINDNFNIKNICINGLDVPKECMQATREFLGTILLDRGDVLLGSFDHSVLCDSKMRQDLVVTSVLNTTKDSCDRRLRDVLSNNVKRIKGVLKKLTDQEKIAIMHTDIKYGPDLSRSVPLVVLLLTNDQYFMSREDIIECLGQKVFQIKFKLDDGEKEYGIISLLEKIKEDCIVDEKRGNPERARFFNPRIMESDIKKLKEIKPASFFIKDKIGDYSLVCLKSDVVGKDTIEPAIPSTEIVTAQADLTQNRVNVKGLSA